MGLNKGYRVFKNEYIDNGEQFSAIMTHTYIPDFKNRHTMQNWAVSPSGSADADEVRIVEAWVGGTLKEHSLHEIYVVNNTTNNRFIFFNPVYQFVDENQPLPETIGTPPSVPANLSTYKLVNIPPNSAAHFIATASVQNGSLFLLIRKGSQDSR